MTSQNSLIFFVPLFLFFFPPWNDLFFNKVFDVSWLQYENKLFKLRSSFCQFIQTLSFITNAHSCYLKYYHEEKILNELLKLTVDYAVHQKHDIENQSQYFVLKNVFSFHVYLLFQFNFLVIFPYDHLFAHLNFFLLVEFLLLFELF